MNSTVCKEYAKVLFEINLDYEYVVNNIENIIEVLKDKEICKFFNHPKIELEEKKRILEESLKLKEKQLLYFLYVLLDNKRLNKLDGILELYKDMVDEKRNIGRFVVYSSYELSNDYLNKIKLLLMKEYKKNVVLDLRLDENLIGGIIIKYKNTIINDSIINKLDELKKIMLNN